MAEARGGPLGPPRAGAPRAHVAARPMRRAGFGARPVAAAGSTLRTHILGSVTLPRLSPLALLRMHCRPSLPRPTVPASACAQSAFSGKRWLCPLQPHPFLPPPPALISPYLPPLAAALPLAWH
jgi:hypothetical protein